MLRIATVTAAHISAIWIVLTVSAGASAAASLVAISEPILVSAPILILLVPVLLLLLFATLLLLLIGATTLALVGISSLKTAGATLLLSLLLGIRVILLPLWQWASIDFRLCYFHCCLNLFTSCGFPLYNKTLPQFTELILFPLSS